jgi:hypothetical protein
MSRLPAAVNFEGSQINNVGITIGMEAGNIDKFDNLEVLHTLCSLRNTMFSTMKALRKSNVQFEKQLKLEMDAMESLVSIWGLRVAYIVGHFQRLILLCIFPPPP